jgi:hypothetical protein
MIFGGVVRDIEFRCCFRHHALQILAIPNSAVISALSRWPMLCVHGKLPCNILLLVLTMLFYPAGRLVCCRTSSAQLNWDFLRAPFVESRWWGLCAVAGIGLWVRLMGGMQVPFIPQLLLIRRARSCEGFNTMVCHLLFRCSPLRLIGTGVSVEHSSNSMRTQIISCVIRLLSLKIT